MPLGKIKSLFNLTLAIFLLSNFQTKAEFSHTPRNIYDFELQMTEHSLGAGITMRFLLSQIQSSPEAAHFPTLMQHTELIYLRSHQHDLSKFVHTPEFVEKYYPRGQTTHLSQPVLKYYGYDIRTNPDSLTQSEIAEAKNSFRQLNVIDNRLLDELVDDYIKKKNLAPETAERLKAELYQFEHMSDLLNRKMYENISRFRKNYGRTSAVKEVFEFGRPIVLDNGNAKDWNSGEHTKRLALKYIYSPTLRHLIINLSPETVVQTYLRHTKDSPFIQDTDTLEVRDKTIEQYIQNRKSISANERYFLLRYKKYNKSLECRMLYGL